MATIRASWFHRFFEFALESLRHHTGKPELVARLPGSVTMHVQYELDLACCEWKNGHCSGRSESRTNVQGEEAKENSELT